MMNFTQALNANAYPGRGILIGKNTAGTHAGDRKSTRLNSSHSRSA